MLAKSNGLDIKTHSEIVYETSLMILKKVVPNGLTERYKDILKYSSLLHDIGKLTINFQRFLKGEIKSPSLKYRHNEIGWAFLSRYLPYNIENRDIILNIVYWHHGISNELGRDYDNDILNDLDDISISNMKDYLESVIGYIDINENYNDSVRVPLYYIDDNKLSLLILCRTCLVSSDRISSSFNSLEELSIDVIDRYFNINGDRIIFKSKYAGTSRFEEQKSIVDKTGKTSLIKAPAGFGKTLLGLLWGLRNKERIIWVVPRNMVGHSVYNSVIEELCNLNISLDVQLVLSGQVYKSNVFDPNLYKSDIIITNIDNFLAPSFKNNIMDCSGLLLGCSVIFDEYHELVSDAPLMSLFIEIMRVRNRLTTSNTLLLSATPIECEKLWDGLQGNNKTIILPNKNMHYKAVHGNKYLLKVINKNDKNPIISSNSSSLVIKNTIKSSQDMYDNNLYDLLLHSDFLEDKRRNDFEYLLGNYGKKSLRSSTKGNVIGTHILQTSLDISFNHLYENVLSPQTTIQRIGRCDRFGDYNNSTITIIKDESKSEDCIKNILYDKVLSDLWFKYLSENDGFYLTLDNFYEIYNNFSEKYSKEIFSFIINKHNESKRYIRNIYPIKYSNLVGKKVLNAGSNKLRSVNQEIFYIVQHVNGKDWVGPFSKTILGSFDKEFKEDSNVFGKMIKTIKKIGDSMDFDYSDIISRSKYITIDYLRRCAKRSDMPYIVYNMVYDEELGIIKKYNKKVSY